MAHLLVTNIGLGLFLAMALTPVQAQETPATEKKKIEKLIKHVEELKDAKFVRNGQEYDAKSAAKFLRGKWETKKTEIKTAKDFIEKAASVSSTTGQPYLIRLKGGKDVKAKEYLLAELKKLEKSPERKQSPYMPHPIMKD